MNRKNYLKILSIIFMLIFLTIGCTEAGGNSDNGGGDKPAVDIYYTVMYNGTVIETLSLDEFKTKYGAKLTETVDYTVNDVAKTITLTKSGYDKVKGTGKDEPPAESYTVKYNGTVIETLSLDEFKTKYGTKLTENVDYTVNDAAKTITLTKSGYDKIKGTGGDEPISGYDVQDLKVTKTTIDSITLQWKAPEKISYPNGYYFTLNGTKSDLVHSYSITSAADGIYSYTVSDEAWRSEAGTEVTVKVSVSYYDSEIYDYKESSGVEINTKTEPFDGTLPCYGDNFNSGNKQTVQKGITFDFASELSRTKFYISDYPDTFEFKSSDDEIATVDENGSVKGLKSGTAKIMFKDSTGIWRYVEFTVVGTRASKIEFVSSIASVDSVWTADNLIFTASDPNVEIEDKNIVWTVSDSSVATVSDRKITFVKEGSVFVTVSYSDNSVSASATITVMQKGSVTKDMMTYDESTGWYTNPEKTMRYNGKMLVETDWNKDGVWETLLSVTHKINNEFNFENFEATVGVNSSSSQDFSVVAVPVVVGENKISITYTVKNLGTSYWSTDFTVNNVYFTSANSLSDETCRILRENVSKYSVDVSADGLSLGTKCFKGSLSNVGYKKSVEFKISYEVKNVTGNLEATIY